MITDGKAKIFQVAYDKWLNQTKYHYKNECHMSVITVYIKVVRCCSVMLYKVILIVMISNNIHRVIKITTMPIE